LAVAASNTLATAEPQWQTANLESTLESRKPTVVAMTMQIQDWHAHIYFQDVTQKAATLKLREAIAAQFETKLGRVHDVPVGPHPTAMYQVHFANTVFPTLVPWLALNRDGLDILVHPNTDDAVADHSSHAIWMGAVLPLNLGVLRR
jgi:DOPA 4,5-dioxygenase